MKVTPKNSLYFTRDDFPEWGEDFSKLYGNATGTEANLNSSGTKERVTRAITFVVTERCNLNCTYCYESHDFHNNGSKMTKEVAKEAIDFLFDKDRVNGYFDWDDIKGINLDFIGGEPLLEIDLIDFICDYFKIKAFNSNHLWATNYMFSMSTNGTLFKTEKVQKFMQKNAGRMSMGITIDGNKELHDSCRVFPNGQGSHDIVLDNMKVFIKDHGGNSTKLTLAPENISHTSEAVKYLWELGLQNVFANCVFEEGWELSHAKTFYEELVKIADFLLKDDNSYKYSTSLFEESIGEKDKEDRNWCGGNGQMLAIGTDGTCYPCLRFMPYSMQSKRDPLIVGNIYDGLNDKDTDDTLCRLCSVTMSSQSNDKCKSCKVSSGCGLCTGFHYDKFGDPNQRATYICETHQARVMANHYYWNNLYKKLKLDKKTHKLNIPKEWALNIVSEEEYEYLLSL